MLLIIFTVSCKKSSSNEVRVSPVTTKLTEPSWARLVQLEELIPGSYYTADKMQVIKIAQDKKTVRHIKFLKTQESINYAAPVTVVKHLDETYEFIVTKVGKIQMAPSLGAEPIDSDECREFIKRSIDEKIEKFGGSQFVFQENGSFSLSNNKEFSLSPEEIGDGSVWSIFGNTHGSEIFQKSAIDIEIDSVIAFHNSTATNHQCSRFDEELDLDDDGFKGVADLCPEQKGSAPEGCPFELSGFKNNCQGQAELASKTEKRFKNKVVEECEAEDNFRTAEFVCHKNLETNTLEWIHQTTDGVDLTEFTNSTCIHIDTI